MCYGVLYTSPYHNYPGRGSSPFVISDTDHASVVRTVGSSVLVTFEIHMTTPGTSCPPLCACQSSERGYFTQTSHICLGTGLSYLVGLLPTVGHFLNCNHLIGVSICCLLQERGRKPELCYSGTFSSGLGPCNICCHTSATSIWRTLPLTS